MISCKVEKPICSKTQQSLERPEHGNISNYVHPLHYYCMLWVKYNTTFEHSALQWHVKITRKTKKCHTVRTTPISNIKIVERDKIDSPNTQIYDPSLF
jgi:hypothetical protein